MPSAAPEDESASDQQQRPPAGLYGEPASGSFDELDPEARRGEWASDLGTPQADPARPEPAAAPGVPQQHRGPGPQGEWDDSGEWPPKSNQDWMTQQGQTGWGLAGGGASWPGPNQPPAEAPPGGQPRTEPDPHGGNANPQGGQQGGLEFPELRADPYSADVYGQSQYRGDTGGQDLYQSDPYQADRLAAEAQAAREQYQADQRGPDPFPPAPQAPQGEQPRNLFGEPASGSYPEQPQPYGDQLGGYGEPAQGAYREQPPNLFGEQPQGAYDQQAAPGAPGHPEPQAPYGEQPSGAHGTETFPIDSQASRADQNYGRAYGEQTDAPATGTDGVPAQRRSEESDPAPAPSEQPPVRVAPPTHRGVRYAIYGIGGLITLGLIIGIVLMLGSTPPDTDQPGGGDDSATPGDGTALTPERYDELAAAAGSAEWFDWRYGEPGEGSGAEEVPAVSGDALAAPLLGEAERSVQGQLGYVTDDEALSGVDHVTAVEANADVISLTPRAGGRFSEDGVPELELAEGPTASCVAGLGVEPGRPVAMARPEQSAEISAHSVIAFASGVIATAGISGAQGGTCLLLPDGQVPTDVALTDGNELALVTTWSPGSQTGALVVIAMSDTAGSYLSSWSEPYPGLPNAGHFSAAEIVGTVALPFTAPTSVDAWSNSTGDSSVERGTVEDGALRDTVATSGYAIVGDLNASQVALVDLTSTLEGLAARAYDGAEFAFDAAAGEAAGFDGGVADVAAIEAGPAVATSDGVVHELDRELAETAATDVGANPTCLVVGSQSGQFIATSRGTGTISWVAGGEVAEQLADSRLTDPLCASETPVLTAGDYTGNAAVVLVTDYEGQRLHAYLDGEAALPNATVGDEGFGYGGAYEVAGRPWGVSVTVDLA